MLVTNRDEAVAVPYMPQFSSLSKLFTLPIALLLSLMFFMIFSVKSPITVHAASSHLSWGAEKMGFDKYAASISNPSKVTVAVIDTGADLDNSFLQGRLVSGFDFGDNDNNPQDIDGHGTYVCSIIADCTSKLNSVKIMPLKVSDSQGNIYSNYQAKAIRYAVNKGANIISITVGNNSSDDHLVDQAINYAVNKGVFVVVSAGNTSSDVSNWCPAHNNASIAVSALDNSLQFASYSNYGKAIDFCAPGTDVYGARLGGGLIKQSGTSASSPHIAAAAAMILSKNPDYSTSKISSALRYSCDDLGEIGKDDLYGYGFVNLRNL